MSDREHDTDSARSVPAEPEFELETASLQPEGSAEKVEWASVLPADSSTSGLETSPASSQTPPEVAPPAPTQGQAPDAVEEDFFGLSENVAVPDPEPVDPYVAPDHDAGPTADSETTQVLRRSLISNEAAPAAAPTPEVAQTQIFEESVTTPSRTTATFEEAMSMPATSVVVDEEALPTLPGRGLARFLSVLLTLIFTPVAWYLIADTGARLAFAPGNPMSTGVLNLAALAELLAGLIALLIIALLAAQSSLGMIVTGVVVMAVGTPFLAVPALVSETGYWGVSRLANWNDFGGNVASHFMSTGFTGLYFAIGFLMLALGWVIAAVRRSGRSEEALRLVVATENPNGMKARWARKATERTYQNQ